MVNRQKKAFKWLEAVKTGSQMLVGKKNARAINAIAGGGLARVAKLVTGESFAKGGKVKRTGLAKVHKGEVVLTASQAKSLKKVLK